MFVFENVKSRFFSLLITLVAIFLIGIVDFKTGVEFSFSFFYIIPIALLSIYGNTNKTLIIIISIVAAICWFVSEFYNREFSLIFYPIWNGLVRLFFFSLIGLLLFNLRIKEKKLSNINDELKRLNNEKNRMIGVAAHDLTNPISAINSFSHLLVGDSENSKEELVEGLEIIENLSSNTLAVLKNLLNVSTIESGKVELKIKKLNYIEFVTQQKKFNQILANNKKIKIALITELDAVDLFFDNNYLSQAIDNLLSNAIKYSTHHSDILIKVSIKLIQANSTRAKKTEAKHRII